MIKIYKLRQLRNNVSHVLIGKNGNTMRYNFTNGNISVGTYPSISLRNEYAQNLLEESELFKRQDVVLERVIKTKEEEEAGERITTRDMHEELGITTPDELLAYVNTAYNKRFSDPVKALSFAAKEGDVFPNLKL